MNSTDGVLGQLLVLAVAVIGISVMIAGAKGPGAVVRFLLCPLICGFRALFRGLTAVLLVIAIFWLIAQSIKKNKDDNPTSPDPAPPSGLATVFDYPVGDEPQGERHAGKGWTVTQDFQDPEGYAVGYPAVQGTHLGEDWARNTGLDASAGGPVYSIAEGELVCVGFQRSLGHTVLIRHRLPEGSEYPYVISFYAHLGAADLPPGPPDSTIKRGQIIGRVGRRGENGKSPKEVDWPPHLHFELRMDASRTGFPDDDFSAGGRWAYHSPPDGFLNPTDRGSSTVAGTGWIDLHR